MGKTNKIIRDRIISKPRMDFFIDRNLATRIEKNKRKKSRKREKQEFLKEIKEYL